MNILTLKVDTPEKIRLDKFLAGQLSDYSRTLIQEQIRAGRVTVDGRSVKAGHQLEGGEQIIIEWNEPDSAGAQITPENIELDVIYEDEALIVINKPAGMVVHPGTGNPTGTLVNGLAWRFRKLSDINGPLRPGIIHRLDRDTSGLIVAAKSNRAHDRLARQFEQRQVEKTYLGITWGVWEPAAGLIDIGIRRQRTDPTRFVAAIDGKPAQTEYQLLEAFRYLSYVRFHPRTGRTHQIRVHAAHAGFAIFGDEVYNGGVNRSRGYLPEVRKILRDLLNTVNRHALHAFQIRFRHPDSDETVQFEAPLPADLQYLLTKVQIFND